MYDYKAGSHDKVMTPHGGMKCWVWGGGNVQVSVSQWGSALGGSLEQSRGCPVPECESRLVQCLQMRMQRSTGLTRTCQAGSVYVLSWVVTCSTCEKLFFFECKANLKEQDNFSHPQIPPWTPLSISSYTTTAAEQLACSVHHEDLCLFFCSVSICIFELSKAPLSI